MDFACGPGGETIDLAELIPDARITALDAYPPFLRDLSAGRRRRTSPGASKPSKATWRENLASLAQILMALLTVRPR